MNFDCAVKVKIGILLIILSALSQNLLMLGDGIRKYRKSPDIDNVTLHENRFIGLKKFLPTHGVVGYVTDQHPDNATGEYYLTQYALSPVIIANETARSFIIGNFHKSINIDEISKNADLILIQELDNGVILFKNKN